ncbi:MAG: hypothetical protein ACPGVU_07425 [Limisphaerales bacterium]
MAALIPKTEHYDDFGDSAGAHKLQNDGQGEETTGDLNNLVYPYAKVSETEGGSIRLKVLEDDATTGPDEEKGVLRFKIESISGKIDHFGAVYVGNNDASEIRINAWTNVVEREDLDGAVLEFRYRGNGRSFNVRLEPEIEESWPVRADFGAVIAADEWQVFTKPISAADNLDVFLEMLNTAKPKRFKIVWGQEGPSSNYQAGDTLLIDDIRIVTPERVETDPESTEKVG